jgi:hypothetical protein
MSVPLPAVPKINKMTAIVAMAAIILMAGSYALFLYATWQQYQTDRLSRDKKIDELLARIPKKETPSES